VTVVIGHHGHEHILINAFLFDPGDMLCGHSAGLQTPILVFIATRRTHKFGSLLSFVLETSLVIN
jgi:hypothetical protein